MKLGWKRLPFGDVLADESGGNVKTPQAEFLANGRYPIVDQGKAPIAGYSDDESRLCRSKPPVIVFGDHTRCVKYVDFPFCMGADGVKVLRPKVEADVKYLYHFLRQLRLTDGGYDRHFKYLRRCEIVVPPLTEQCRLADILDRAEALRAKRRAALALLDTLTQAIFLDLFGDPVSNPKGWLETRLLNVLDMPLRNGLSPSKSGKLEAKVLTLSAVTGHGFNAAAWKTSTFLCDPPADQRVDEADFLVCRGNGNLHLVGKGYFPTTSQPDVTFPDTMIAARISAKCYIKAFFQHFWNTNRVRQQIDTLARTTNGTFKINQPALESVVMLAPPLSLQHEFARRVAAVQQLRSAQRRSLAKLDELFASLQHRAFAGEL